MDLSEHTHTLSFHSFNTFLRSSEYLLLFAHFLHETHLCQHTHTLFCVNKHTNHLQQVCVTHKHNDTQITCSRALFIVNEYVSVVFIVLLFNICNPHYTTHVMILYIVLL